MLIVSKAATRKFGVATLILTFSLVSKSAIAVPEFLTWWSEEYPASTSDNAICQLCHERSNGGNGWNEYGIRVRIAFLANRMGSPNTIEQDLRFSLQDIEDTLTNTNDPQSPTFLDEINANTQPGWRVGEVNVITLMDDSTPRTISPPINLPAGVLIDPGSTGTPDPTNDPQPSSIVRGRIQIALETVADGFTAPVFATPAPGQPDFLYVVEQAGMVWRVDLAEGIKTLFLDLSANVVPLGVFGQPISGGYDERGLLGIAFHPDYVNNNKIYTYISEPFRDGVAHFSTLTAGQQVDHLTVVSEWIVANPSSSPASATNERELLIIEQPQFNHNGGMLDFGPDGFLYISLGDGGGSNDQGDGHGVNGNGRNFENPLGAILRIDVDEAAPANGRYGIPAINPFVGQSGLDEIIAYGFRNPFRFSFETLANNQFNFWVGDVGQNAIEEIDKISSSSFGGNYGWNYKEGSLFFYPPEDGGSAFVSADPPQGVALPNLIEPIAEYDHDEGISVIGGHVYSGSMIPDLVGRYVFADYGRSFSVASGRLFYLDQSNQIKEFGIDGGQANIFISSFAKGANQELYVLGSRSIRTDSDSGSLNRIVVGNSGGDLCIPIKSGNEAVTLICL